MSVQITHANTAVAASGIVERFADRLGMIALLVMGLAMGGVTAFAGL